MFNAKSLEELETLYVKDQDNIAKSRELGLFKTYEEDIAAQKESWESYLIEKYELSGEAKDKDAIIDYYGGIAIGEHTETRDAYYSGVGTTLENVTAKKDIFINYEAKLIAAGVLDKQTTDKIKDEFLLQAKIECEKIKTDRTAVTAQEAPLLCDSQMPIVNAYIQSLKDKS